MSSPLRLSKSDSRRAMVRHHFAPCATQVDAFERLRSIQFDPIAPVGCNHDLVLQARVPGYKIGGWQKTTYKDRYAYDGWDKQASLVPFESWPTRRIFHKWHAEHYRKIFEGHKDAVDAILAELKERGPLMPKDCEFQQRKEEWKTSWHGPNVSKQTLRALWHAGIVVTTARKNGHHVYDLAERVVPPHLFNAPMLSEAEFSRELVLDRHRAVGFLRPNASSEVWSYHMKAEIRNAALKDLIASGEIVPVEIEGVKAHATPTFLKLLDEPSLDPRVVFIAPLDQLMWDRKMIADLFDFDYVWEIYMPEPKRRWGYYVLPVLYGDTLVARIEFWCRDGVLEIRKWYLEDPKPTAKFWTAFKRALKDFMKYCSATIVTVLPDVDEKLREICESMANL